MCIRDRVRVVHRGFGGVWFDRVEHPGRVGQSSHGGAKRDTFRVVSDYQAVNSQVEQTPKVMTDLLRYLDCNVWVDDVFCFAEDEISLLCLLDEMLGRLESVAVHSPCDADDSLLSVDVIRAAQRKAVADLGDNLRSFSDDFRSSYLG